MKKLPVLFLAGAMGLCVTDSYAFQASSCAKMFAKAPVLQLVKARQEAAPTAPVQSAIQKLAMEYSAEIQELVSQGIVSISDLRSAGVLTAKSRKSGMTFHFLLSAHQNAEGKKSLTPLIVFAEKPVFQQARDPSLSGRIGFVPTSAKRWGSFQDISPQRDGLLFDLVNGGLIRFSLEGSDYAVRILPQSEIDPLELFKPELPSSESSS